MPRKKGSKNKNIIQPEPKILSEIPQSKTLSEVKLTLQANNQEYQSNGESILEALNNIPLDWIQIKTKGTIIIHKDGKIATKFFNFIQLRMLVRSKFKKIVQAKYLEMLLK